LERDVLAAIGELPIDQSTAAIACNSVEKIAASGADETPGEFFSVSRIFQLARSRGLVRENDAIDRRSVRECLRNF
jgi:hypothetical protein